jgi:hypothetical protein
MDFLIAEENLSCVHNKLKEQFSSLKMFRFTKFGSYIILKFPKTKCFRFELQLLQVSRVGQGFVKKKLNFFLTFLQ